MNSVSAARTDAASALRQLGHDLVGHVADDDLLSEIAATLRSLSTRLNTGERRSRDVFGDHGDWNRVIGEGEAVPSWGDRPFSGTASPWSLEPDVRRVGDSVVARVTFHQAHEGAPERAHGGLVAALFDDVMGSVMSVTREGGFTGELTVRYAAATPLHRELLCTCAVTGQRRSQALHHRRVARC